MRKKNQKFGHASAIPGEAPGNDPQPQPFGRYRVSGNDLGNLVILAHSAKEAEFIARNILGSEIIYREPKGLEDIDRVIKALLDPRGIYEGPLEVRREETVIPARAARR
jgi:hypothetical protein